MNRIASCSCGALTAVCEGEPIRVSVCHCLACQQRTGSVFGTTARFEAGKVRLVGPRSHWERTGDEGTTATFSFCPTCGATVAWTNDAAPEMVAVAVGAFADPLFPAPRRTVYEDRAHGWVELHGIEERD